MNSPLKSVDKIRYDHGFKRVSIANLLERDEHPAYPSRLRGKKWVEACLKPRLANRAGRDHISF